MHAGPHLPASSLNHKSPTGGIPFLDSTSPDTALGCREEAVLRPPQSQVLAQGLALVFAAEEAPALQFRNDPVDEFVEPARDPWEHDVEAVAGIAIEPLLHLVGDGARRPDHRQAAI